jgi:hypothetical protein
MHAPMAGIPDVAHMNAEKVVCVLSFSRRGIGKQLTARSKGILDYNVEQLAAAVGHALERAEFLEIHS